MAKYSEVLFRHKIRFASLFLIAITLTAGVAVGLAGFRATATMSVADPASFGATFVPVGWSQNLTPAQNIADASAVVLKTPAFSQSLADALTAEGAASSQSETQQVISSLPTSFRIAVAGSHLVVFTYSCRNGAFCVQVLGAGIAALREQLIQSERNQADATTAFWTAQLTDAQANLKSAQGAVQSYARAHPGVTSDASSTDPQVALLLEQVKQWQAKVAEAQGSLTLAQYTSSASARLIELGTSVVTAPQLATPGLSGDGSSLRLAALTLAAALLIAIAYLFGLAWVDQTVRDPRTIERRLGVPVVATIPKLVGSRGG